MTGLALSTRSKRALPTPLLLALLGVLVLLPLGFVALAAFTTSVPRPGAISLGRLTLANFAIFRSSEAARATLNSVLVGAASSVLAVAIGSCLAFVAARTDAYGRRFVYVIGLAPLFLPALVGALAWSLLAAPSSGLLNLALREVGLGHVNVYSTYGLVAVLAMYYAPYSFLLVHSSLVLMNADLEEAATVHGARLSSMLRAVTLPLVVPAMLGSAVLVFALTVENFPVAQVIGVPGGVDTLPAFIYRLMNASPAQSNAAAAVAIVLTLTLLAVTAAQQRVVSRRRYTTVTGKGARPRVIRLRRWRLPVAVLCWCYFALAVVLPVSALLVTALQASPYLGAIGDLFQAGALTTGGFRTVLAAPDFRDAMRNSVVVGLLVAAGGTTLSFLLSYVRYRTKAYARSSLEYVSMAPLAIPSIVLGMGLLWTWLVLPVPIYGTLLVLVVAFLAVFLPQGYRGVSASILQVDRDLEDSAVMLGSSRARAVTWVTVPLMRVGITSTFLLLLMLAMRELSAALFIFTSQTRLLSIVIFDSYDNGSSQAAAVISVLYCALIAVLTAAARRLAAGEQIAP